MEGIYSQFTVRTCFSFLLLILLQTSTEAQICSAPLNVDFAENQAAGVDVVTITAQSTITLAFTSPATDNPFRLEGHKLKSNRVFDLESETESKIHTVNIACTDPASSITVKPSTQYIINNIMKSITKYVSLGFQLGIVIVVILKDVNDNPPTFDMNPYNITVEEMSPVDKSVGNFPAIDLDETSEIFYSLTSDSNAFKLASSRSAVLLVETPLEYDKVKNVQLILRAQDTPLTGGSGGVSHTATTTINVAITDVDNRPPWFQPCTMHNMDGTLICQSAGYTGRVVLNEQEIGALPLKPGPLKAIDGDSGINEEITYSFVGGEDGGGLFAIDLNTGLITMLKPADVVGTISLTVLAAQKTNRFQFATTSVTISVQVKSLHAPRFQRPQYEAVVSSVGAMAMDSNNTDDLLHILATDDDYIAAGGLNPYITYSITGSTDFSVINGYLFMTKQLADSTLSLQIVATDTSNDETAVAQLSMEVKSGLTTTSLPLSTTDSTATPSVGESTTNSQTTEDTVPTTNPATTGQSTISVTSSSVTSEGGISTASSPHPATVIIPSGGYGPADMAALGATLGVLLFICLVVIVVFALRIQREKTDWKKIHETSTFRSTMGQGSGSPKEGMQYTNDAFIDDEGGDSPEVGKKMAGEEPQKASGDLMLEEAIVKSTVPLHALLGGDAIQEESDKDDNDKEMKPILTREKRMDDGYKSVWFKEDIDPDAKEEVVIIPDSREDDSEDEEEEEQSSSSREENDDDDDDNLGVKTPRVVFNDADLDSGLGVRIEDPAEDSEGGERVTYDL
ncbi:cadherin-related family member 5 [Labrus mixtus]|uniref:cadherin-related family member 5 n=1 Tax=Labrus mixtus TaxID=508554 RepID=UPI0029C03BBF|nr:cadherin-related family member 5 [Labrus mixtus]